MVVQRVVIKVGFKDHRSMSHRMFYAANKDCTELTDDVSKAHQFVYGSSEARRNLINYAYGEVSDYWRGRKHSEGSHWMDFDGKFEGTWVSDMDEALPKAAIRWESKEGIKVLGYIA